MPQINISGKGSRDYFSKQNVDPKRIAADERSQALMEKTETWKQNQIAAAAKELKQAGDHVGVSISDGAKELRKAGEAWKKNFEREIQWKEKDVRRKEQNDRKWENIRLRDERRQQREIKEELSKRERIARFNTNLAALQEQSANRPGLMGRVILGGANYVGGHRLREATQVAFGIGGRRGKGGSGGGGRGGGFSGGSGGSSGGGGFLGGLDEAGELASFGEFGMAYAGFKVAQAVYKIVKSVAFAPQAYSGLMSRAMSASEPYTSLAISSANIGRGGGFEGADLMGRLFPGSKAPDWMWKRGITSPQQATDIIGAYGSPISSAGEGQSVLESVGDAFMSPALGGLPHERYAQSLGLARQLGVTAPQGGVGNPSRGSAMFMSRDEYWREFQKTAAVAQTVGLDRSQVMDNIESLLRASVSAGAPNANMGATGDFWWRYASSGAPSARTGEMQTSVLAGQAQGVGQLGSGGGVAQNAAFYTYSMKKFGGKVPTDLNAFAAGYNIDVSKLTSGQRAQLSDAHQNALAGRWLPAADIMKDFLQGTGQTQTWLDISQSALGGMPPSMKNWGTSNVSGVPLNSIYAGQNGQTGRAIPESSGINYSLSSARGIRDRNPLNLKLAAGQGTVGHDADFGVYASMPEGVAANLRQLKRYQDQGDNTVRKMVNRWVSDPNFDSTGYVNDVAKTMGISPDAPFDITNPAMAQSYIRAAAQHESGSVTESDIRSGVGLAFGDTSNQVLGPDGKPIYQGQGNAAGVVTKGGEQATPLLNTLTPDTILTFNDGIVAATNSAFKFTAAFDGLTDKISRLNGGSQSVEPTTGVIMNLHPQRP